MSLSDTKLNALLRAARASRYGQRNYAICQLLLQTGMRLGECQALRWQDIEYNERKGSVLIRAGKGKSPFRAAKRLGAGGPGRLCRQTTWLFC